MSKEERLAMKRALEWLEFFDKNYGVAPAVRPTILRLRRILARVTE
jgi:hypothetical protein